jgi:hypothetical protein
MEKEEKHSEQRFHDGKKMEIEINKYKQLVETFNNPKSLAKVILVVSLIIVLVFGGVSGVALIVKRFYPYNTIKSNKYGATVIQNEDSDVTYWLFNSADLWSNSGIEVKKGQIITVRTSGAFNTAIHRLVQAADENKEGPKWLSPTGGNPSLGLKNDDEKKDNSREKYKISTNNDFNVIMMQVLPKKLEELGNEWFKEKDTNLIMGALKDSKNFRDYIDGGMPGEYTEAKIYVIGSEKADIEIQEDGVLYFACNDIALTDRKRKAMERLIKWNENTCRDTGSLNIGRHPYDTKKNELSYYDEKNYVDAWFADNVGSFLIVVERKNSK